VSVPRARARAPAARRSERAQLQCQRIVAAAEQCFVDKGFHAASIADIAAAAGMSQGLLYRYFRNKSAIVRAIINNCVNEEVGKTIDALETPDELLNAILEVFERWSRGDEPRMNAALMLETTAEATRNEEIAAVVREANLVVRGSLENAMRRSTRAQGVILGASELRGRTIILQAIIEGLAVRAIREPDLDRSELRSALKSLLATLMSNR
jgi:AcrR family transcriptional regulator